MAVAGTSTRLMTVIVGIVVALMFCFGFGNVLALGLRLGVPSWLAPLHARSTCRSSACSAAGNSL
jgi:hypothetical protein